jgi:hypothetical protein
MMFGDVLLLLVRIIFAAWRKVNEFFNVNAGGDVVTTVPLKVNE